MPYLVSEMNGKSNDTAAFAAGLLNPNAAKPDVVIGPQGGKADKRYNVYRNNVTVSLINTVADIFPAVQKIVGEDNFRILAREYVRAYPPSSPLLFLYGQDFAEFIEAFEHTKKIPFLPDVARVERAWLTAYHAADLAALDAAKLSMIDPNRLADIRFKIHPATAIIASKFPIQDIFLMNRGFMEIAPVNMEMSQSIMLTRPETETRLVLLDEDERAFFQAIAGGRTLGEAAAEGTNAENTFNLNTSLQMLLGTGATTHIQLDEKEI